MARLELTNTGSFIKIDITAQTNQYLKDDIRFVHVNAFTVKSNGDNVSLLSNDTQITDIPYTDWTLDGQAYGSAEALLDALDGSVSLSESGTNFYPLISRFLDKNGDGTGDINANEDYSSAEEIFYIQPPSDETFVISRMISCIEDTSGFRAERYGNLASALAVGVKIRVFENGVENLVTEGPLIKRNADWAAHCYDADLKSWGAGNEFLVIRWTFARYGSSFKLNGATNDRFEVVVNDDLTGLISHQFFINGYRL